MKTMKECINDLHDSTKDIVRGMESGGFKDLDGATGYLSVIATTSLNILTLLDEMNERQKEQ